MKLKKILSLAAISFLAVAIASCDSKKKGGTDDDDDDDENKSDKKEKLVDIESNKSHRNIPSTADVSQNVILFCLDVDNVTNSFISLDNIDQIKNMSKKMRKIFDVYRNDETPFDDADREIIYKSLFEMYSAVMIKQLDYNYKGEDIDEDQLNEVFEELKQVLARIVYSSDNFAELFPKLRNM